MKTFIRTSTGSYPVITGHGVIGETASAAGITAGRKVTVITDDNVAHLHLEKLLAVLPEGAKHIVIPHGEQSKNWALAGELLEQLAADDMPRDGVIVALGGGVVGDLAGFVAGTYMRGIDYVQVPTTLLAAIDSSVGGKTAVDLKAGKNLAGRIYPPKAVVCDLDMLSTLPKAEWKCGLGEAVKYAVLAGGEIYDIMQAGAENDLERLVDLCIDDGERARLPSRGVRGNGHKSYGARVRERGSHAQRRLHRPLLSPAKVRLPGVSLLHSRGGGAHRPRQKDRGGQSERRSNTRHRTL